MVYPTSASHPSPNPAASPSAQPSAHKSQNPHPQHAPAPRAGQADTDPQPNSPQRIPTSLPHRRRRICESATRPLLTFTEPKAGTGQQHTNQGLARKKPVAAGAGDVLRAAPKCGFRLGREFPLSDGRAARKRRVGDRWCLGTH